MDNSLTSDSRVSMNRTQDQVNGNLGHRNQQLSSTSEPVHAVDTSATNSRTDSEKNEAQVPSEVITSCVATLLMIQVIQDILDFKAHICILYYATQNTHAHTLCPSDIC